MKRLIILLLISASYSFQSYAQTYKITYIEKLNVNAKLFANYETPNNEEIPSKEETEEVEQSVKKYSLIHQNGISVYQLEEDLFEKEGETDNSISTFYKKFTTDELIQINSILAENEGVKADLMSSFDWYISQEMREINGYLCKKAIRMDTKDEAWFTEEIPVNDGPGENCGLPGLIVKMYSKNSSYERTIQIDEVEILKDNIEKIEIPEKEKFITPHEFNKKVLRRL